MDMRIAIGCDEAACAFRDAIKAYLAGVGCEAFDFGTFDDRPVLYPDIAVAVARAVAEGDYDRGILICGTGIGMAIAANKVPGIRAAVCHDPLSAERARKSNDCQILCMGARIIAPQLGIMLTDTWLRSNFEGGGSMSKVGRILHYETQFYGQARRGG